LNLNESTPITIESDLLPKGWQVVKLGDAIEELKNGFASGKRDENGIVQIRMNNVTTDGRLIFDSYLKVPVPENINNWLLKKGDLLFNNTNSIDLVGKSTIFKGAPFSCTFSNHFTRLRFKKEMLLPELILYHFLILWKNDYFKSVAIRHVGQSAVHTSYLLKLQIPLPPLPEQRRIAEVLGTVDSAIQKVGGAIERTERLKKGLMQRMLTMGIGHERFKETEVGRMPEEWKVVKLNDVCQQIIDCPHTTPKFVENGVLVIRNFNIRDGRLSLQESYYTTNEEYNERIKRCTPAAGDILFSREAPIGEACLIPLGLQLSLGQRTMLIRPIPTILNAQFQVYSFYSNLIRPLLLRKGGGATAHHLNVAEVRKLEIPLPSLAEQRRIAEILSAVDRKLELERRRKEKLERVKKGLMNELLTGRKRVKVEE
jgi:type I restriction enzyme S subunit